MATTWQAGIAGTPPEHVLLVALSFTQAAPASVSALSSLQELIRRELQADIDEINPDSPGGQPSADTGELGVETGYDTTNLTLTLGISSTGFTALGLSAPNLPADLFPINWADLADSPVNPSSGDLVLQICADSIYIVEHVLRRIEHSLAGQFNVVWTLAGEQRNGSAHGGALHSGVARALIGFHDGLSNLDPNNQADQPLIFIGMNGAPPLPPTPPSGPQVAPGPGQPAYNQAGSPQPEFPTTLREPPGQEQPWATCGSYLMVRATLMNLAAWDQLALATQQSQVGRFKYSGATLDNPNELAHQADAPVFASSPNDDRVPPNSHIRRAFPRTTQADADRRIFRRGYPIITATATGSLQRGLLFIAYGRSLSTQADFIMKAWLKNPNFPMQAAGVDPLLQNEVQASAGISQVLAGGYYFVPAISDPDQPWSWVLPPGA